MIENWSKLFTFKQLITFDCYPSIAESPLFGVHVFIYSLYVFYIVYASIISVLCTIKIICITVLSLDRNFVFVKINVCKNLYTYTHVDTY